MTHGRLDLGHARGIRSVGDRDLLALEFDGCSLDAVELAEGLLDMSYARIATHSVQRFDDFAHFILLKIVDDVSPYAMMPEARHCAHRRRSNRAVFGPFICIDGRRPARLQFAANYLSIAPIGHTPSTPEKWA
jgi:hypothetical protein